MGGRNLDAPPHPLRDVLQLFLRQTLPLVAKRLSLNRPLLLDLDRTDRVALVHRDEAVAARRVLVERFGERPHAHLLWDDVDEVLTAEGGFGEGDVEGVAVEPPEDDGRVLRDERRKVSASFLPTRTSDDWWLT